MKKRIPSKVIEVCDLCQRATAVLTKCESCDRTYCFLCEAIICGCIVKPDICKTCGGNDAILAVVEKYAKPLARIVAQRSVGIKAAR